MAPQLDTTKYESSRDHAWAADALMEHSAEILEDYQRQLEGSENLLALGSGFTEERLKAEGRATLDLTARHLRGEAASREDEDGFYLETAHGEDAIMAHSDDSFQAGMMLCEAAMAFLERELPDDYSLRDAVALTLKVQESIMTQVGQASVFAHANHLLNKVHETQVEERKRFSRELHDRVAHSIAIINQNLELYEFLRERDPTAAAEKMERVRKMGRDAVRTTRDMAWEMREMESFEELSILLENLLNASVAPGVEYEIIAEGEESQLVPRVRSQLYLILREGIRNAVTHSGSKKVEVTLDVSPEEVRVGVTDYGDGFELNENSPWNGVGIRSMKERTSLLGGTLEVSSIPGDGTRVVAHVPLEKDGRGGDG